MIPFSKSPVNRRRFLRGMGAVAVGLPFLESLTPRHARAESPAIKRFGVFFCCNGVNMQNWFPTTEFGALSEASFAGTSNAALAPFAKKLIVPRGVHMSPRGWDQDGGGGDDHGKGMAHKLTAQFANEDWLALGESVDQFLARQINPGNEGARRAPLTLYVGKLRPYRGLSYISYRGPADAVAGVENPWNAYSDFMNLGGDGSEPSEAMDRIARRRQSVLDLVKEQFDDLKSAPLSKSDRDKLDAHFTALRGLEETMGEMPGLVVSCLDPALSEAAARYESMAKLIEDEAEYPKLAELMVDITALVFACDANRVATIQFGNGAGGPTFRWSGMNHEYNHHKLSHGKVRDDCFGDSVEDGCEDVNGYQDMLTAIDTWHQSQFARLLEKLDSYEEADGKTVLDNSAILYTNELSDGKDHSWMDLPYILAGSAGGAFRQGEYILLGEGGAWDPEKAPHNRLLNTIVNVMGVESDWFGVAEGGGGQTMQSGMYEALLA